MAVDIPTTSTNFLLRERVFEMKAQKIHRRKIAVALLAGMLLTAPPLSLTAEAQARPESPWKWQSGESWEEYNERTAELRRATIRDRDRRRGWRPTGVTPPPVTNNGAARRDLRY
jgi:hypothetical protein